MLGWPASGWRRFLFARGRPDGRSAPLIVFFATVVVGRHRPATDRVAAAGRRPAGGAQRRLRHPGRSPSWSLVLVLLFPLAAGPVLRPGHRARRAVHPAGPRPEHHARPGRPARPGLRRLLRRRRLHRRPADLDRPSTASPTGPSGQARAVRGAVRDAVRRSSWACPSCGIRGDYLAIATLGFGEIIRILAGSDLLKPLLGGPRGIINIPKPIDVPPTNFLAGPVQIYYIALALRGGRRVRGVAPARVASGPVVDGHPRGRGRGRGDGRQPRPDQAAGVHAGRRLRRPRRRDLRRRWSARSSRAASSCSVSINVVAIVIVGGMGSIPGVVLGALVLIGLPELFREFTDYRFLFYGIALIGDDALPAGRPAAVRGSPGASCTSRRTSCAGRSIAPKQRTRRRPDRPRGGTMS